MQNVFQGRGLVLAIGVGVTATVAMSVGAVWGLGWRPPRSAPSFSQCQDLFRQSPVISSINPTDLRLPFSKPLNLKKDNPLVYQLLVLETGSLAYSYDANPDGSVCLRVAPQGTPNQGVSLEDSSSLQPGTYLLEITPLQDQQKLTLSLWWNFDIPPAVLLGALYQRTTTEQNLEDLPTTFRTFVQQSRESKQGEGESPALKTLVEYWDSRDPATLKAEVEKVVDGLLNLPAPEPRQSPGSEPLIISNDPDIQRMQHLYFYQLGLTAQNPTFPAPTGILDAATLKQIKGVLFQVYLDLIEGCTAAQKSGTQTQGDSNVCGSQDLAAYLDRGNFEDLIQSTLARLDSSSMKLPNLSLSLQNGDDAWEMAQLYYRTLRDRECDRNWALLSDEYRKNEFRNNPDDHGEWCREQGKWWDLNAVQVMPIANQFQRSQSPDSNPHRFEASLQKPGERESACQILTVGPEPSSGREAKVLHVDGQSSACGNPKP